jgi:hypothetical protein
VADSETVTLYEMSDQVRHWEISYGSGSTARLYIETFTDGQGKAGSTCRLHFDREVAEPELRRVIDAVQRAILDHLPRGLCLVYTGKLAVTLDIGSDRTLQ